jgi:Sulfotransferase family
MVAVRRGRRPLRRLARRILWISVSALSLIWLVQWPQEWTTALQDGRDYGGGGGTMNPSTMEKQTMPLSFVDTVVVERNLQAKAASSLSSLRNETSPAAQTPGKAAGYRYAVEPDLVPPTITLHRVVFQPWNLTRHPWPCFHPTNGDDSVHWTNKKKVLRTRTTTGLFYVKLLKTASSTCASVHVRMARNVARTLPHAGTAPLVERGRNKPSSSSSSSSSVHPNNWDVCQTRHLHGQAGPRGLDYRRRDANQSFLWSVVRHPVPRYVSEFLHFAVARRGVAATPTRLISYLSRGRHANQHQVAWLSLSLRKHQEMTYADFARLVDSHDTDALQALSDRTKRILDEIMNGYNFLGVAERLDETLVVLSLLLHRPLADVLHVSVKMAGGYDDGAFHNRCVRIPTVPDSFVDSTEVQSFLSTDPAWQAYIHAEQVLYAAVNASLDATIDFLGRNVVQRKVTQLQRAQQVVTTACRPVLPCTTDGVRIPDAETDCLQGDLACGMDCLDDVATRLELW